MKNKNKWKKFPVGRKFILGIDVDFPSRYDLIFYGFGAK